MQGNSLAASRGLAMVQLRSIFSKEKAIGFNDLAGFSRLHSIKCHSIIGSLAALLIFPGLIGGMLYSAQEVSSGKSIKLDYLWIVFKDPKKRNEFS